MLTKGSTGVDVKELQIDLNTLGYNSGSNDGVFGPKTEAAVKAFQKANGLTVDGIVGPQTQSTIKGKLANREAAKGFLRLGVKNTNVAVLQGKLKALGYNPGPVDGDFGPNTQKAVIAFQGAKGITQDGIVGPITLRLLEADFASLSAPVSKPEITDSIAHPDIKVIPFENHLEQVPNRNTTKYIIAHHQAGWLSFLDVNREHLNKGWACFGYHFQVEPDGTVIQGRPIEKTPAACYGLNDCSVNICLVGNCMQKEPTAAQLIALEWLVPYIRIKYPETIFIGHKEAPKYSSYATSTDCPGTLFPLEQEKAKLN